MPGNPMSPRSAIPLPSNASFDEIERRAWVEGSLDERLIDLAYERGLYDVADVDDL